MRRRIARALMRLAAKVDNRPDVCYEITSHTPQYWANFGKTR